MCKSPLLYWKTFGEVNLLCPNNPRGIPDVLIIMVDSNRHYRIIFSRLTPEEEEEEDREHKRMCKALSLCIAYAANVGGIGSLTGTIPNIVARAQADM